MLSKTISKIFGRPSGDDDSAGAGTKLRQTASLKLPHRDTAAAAAKEKPRQEMEVLAANLFAGVSAVKASYAHMQAAQSPYNPSAVQAADEAVVDRLRELSQLKRTFLNKQQSAAPPAAGQTERQQLAAAYEAASKKLEAELERKDAEVLELEERLMESGDRCRDLETLLHRDMSPSALRKLGHSELNASHFVLVLRCAVRSVRNFVKQLVREMESAGWDLDAAAIAAAAGTPHRRRLLAFESFVCLAMFDGFHRRDFGLRGGLLEGRRSWDRRRFFEEFFSSESGAGGGVRRGGGRSLERSAEFTEFVRAKYAKLVHPKMEASFFGELDARAMVGSRGLPSSIFSAAYVDMAKRIWQLHCLFFSFPGDGDGATPAVFQVSRGTPFSEVYMEIVGEENDGFVVSGAAAPPVVAFTVVPGFRVGGTVVQCRVCVASEDSWPSGGG